jgi:hypothetical protein
MHVAHRRVLAAPWGLGASQSFNISKSMMVPINLNIEKLNHLGRTFDCQVSQKKPLIVKLVLSPSHIWACQWD